MNKYIPLILRSSVRSFNDIGQVLSVDGIDIYDIMLDLESSNYDKQDIANFTRNFVYYHMTNENMDEKTEKLVNYFFKINRNIDCYSLINDNIKWSKENQKYLLAQEPGLMCRNIISNALYDKFDKKIFNEAILNISNKIECTSILISMLDKMALLSPLAQDHLMKNFDANRILHVKTKKVWKALKQISNYAENYHFKSLSATIHSHNITESGVKIMLSHEDSKMIEDFKNYYIESCDKRISDYEKYVINYLTNLSISKEKDVLINQLADTVETANLRFKI